MVEIAPIIGEAKKMSNIKMSNIQNVYNYLFIFFEPATGFLAGDWHLWYSSILHTKFMLKTL